MIRTLTTLLVLLAIPCSAADKKQKKGKAKPIAELKLLTNYVGVWDAEIVVWPQGPKGPQLKMKGVETSRAFGKHWIASDFESTFMGTKMTVHSIVGYDLDKKSLVATIIDDGPYKATMTGKYDAKSKTVHWLTKGKHPNGTPLVQKTTISHNKPNERILILNVPGPDKKFVKFMRIRYVKRKG